MHTLTRSIQRHFYKEANPKKNMVNLLRNLPKPQWVINEGSHRLKHPVFKLDEIENLENVRREPHGIRDHVALTLCKIARGSFDFFSRYDPPTMTEKNWLFRVITLETVAGIPGMVGGMLRHMKSIRTLKRDQGWINHLLQEAENERMHLFIFMHQRQPNFVFRIWVFLCQGV